MIEDFFCGRGELVKEIEKRSRTDRRVKPRRTCVHDAFLHSLKLPGSFLGFFDLPTRVTPLDFRSSFPSEQSQHHFANGVPARFLNFFFFSISQYFGFAVRVVCFFFFTDAYILCNVLIRVSSVYASGNSSIPEGAFYSYKMYTRHYTNM